jgi:predicted N-acyltransferase
VMDLADPRDEGRIAPVLAIRQVRLKAQTRRPKGTDIRFEMRSGAELGPADWRRVHALHAQTFHRHGHEPYLSAEFFAEISRTLPGQPQVLLARAGGEIIATAIYFRGSDTLYGRYWGASGDFHSLHFEACYHQGIEYCIGAGLARFEPGTQGEHKLARGFEPAITHSAHHIADARFGEAIALYLAEERAAVRAYAADAGQHLPFRAASALAVPPQAP